MGAGDASPSFEYEAAGIHDGNLTTIARRNLVREERRDSFAPESAVAHSKRRPGQARATAMIWLQSIARAVLLAVSGTAIGGLIGALLAGETGVTLGAVFGLVVGMQLAARYLLDQHAISQAEKDAAAFLVDGKTAVAQANQADMAATHQALDARRAGLATLLRRQRRLSDTPAGPSRDTESHYAASRLAGRGQRHHDLVAPPGLAKRKGKPKRHLYG